jgi:hypothetical protein
MVLQSDLDQATAEKMLPEFIIQGDGNHSFTHVTETEPIGEIEPPPEEPSVPETAVDKKIQEAKRRLDAQMASRAEKMREQAIKAEADKQTKQQQRMQTKQDDKARKDAYKESTQGKAAQYIPGVERDLKKCKSTIMETCTCGMKAGFAREWKATFQILLEKFETHLAQLEELKTGTDSNDTHLTEAKATGERFKLEVRNFNTAKQFAQKTNAKLQPAQTT